MGWFDDALDFIADPIGESLGIKGPGTLTQPWEWGNLGSDIKSDWSVFKHLLVPDMRRDREAQIQSATNARNIVYGRTRVGGTIAYAETTGALNETLHILYIHAGHEIDGYEEIYFDDKLVASAAGGWVIAAPYTGKVTIELFDGSQTAACASLVAASAGGWTVDHKLLGLAYSHITLTYDEGVFPTGLPGVKAVLRGKKVLDTRTSSIAWSVNPAMCIRDYALLDVDHGGMGCEADEINEVSFTNAANICDQMVESMIALDASSNPVTPGVKSLYKPVTSSYEKRYTLNGEIRLDGAPTSFIKSMLTSMAGEAIYSEGQWKIFAGAPSASVATIDESWLNGGISFQVGNNKNDKTNTAKGTFTNSNDYWADTEFPEVPTGASTPPNATYWTTVATPAKYNPALTYVQNSYVTWGGKVYQAYSATTVPINTPPPASSFWVLVEMHDNSLQYPAAYKVQRSGSVYTSTGIVPISNPYLAEDGGEVLTANLTLPFTITSSEAQRLAKIAMEKSRRGFSISYSCNHRAFALEVMDVVTVNNARMGMIGKLFRIVGWDFSLMGGTSLSLAEYDPAVYSWLPGDSTPLVSPIITKLPDPWTVAAPTGFTATEVLYTGVAIANTKSKLNLAWVSAQVSGTLYDISFAGKIIQTISETSYTINDLAPGTYDVSVRAKNSLGTVSTWVTIVKVVAGKYTPPSNVAGFSATFAGNLIKLAWTANTEIDLAGYEIRTGASWAAGSVLLSAQAGNGFTYRPTASGAIDYWIKALDTAGNESITAATATVTVPTAAAPTGITPTGVMFGIDLAVAYPDTLDIDYCEIWAGTTNDRAAASSIGITRNGKFSHEGLGNAAIRYYWARTMNVFQQNSTWYPSSATAGVQGTTIADPSAVIALLNANLNTTALADYLAGTGSFTDIVDTFTPAALEGVGGAGVFATKGEMLIATDRQIQLKAGDTDMWSQITLLNDSINLKASSGDLSAQVDILSDAIGLKLNATGTVGPGMLISWTDGGHTKSQIQFQTDTFQVSKPDGTGTKSIFTVGTVGGTSAVGISGDLFVDGSVSASKIATGELIVGTNVGLGTAQTAGNVTTIIGGTVTTSFVNALNIVAGSVAAENISGTVITGKTIQTKADPGTGDRSRFVVSTTDNYSHFYDANNVDRIVIGTGTSDGLTSYIMVGKYGDSSSVAGIIAFSASGDALTGRSQYGYAGVFGGQTKGGSPVRRGFAGKAQLYLEPSFYSTPTADSVSLGADLGSVYMSMDGEMYVKKTAGWKKVTTEA